MTTIRMGLRRLSLAVVAAVISTGCQGSAVCKVPAYVKCTEQSDGLACNMVQEQLRSSRESAGGHGLPVAGDARRLQCLTDAWKAGCEAGSGYACAKLGEEAADDRDMTKSRALYLAACDRGSAYACYLATSATSRVAPPAVGSRDELLATKSCDLGNHEACLWLVGARANLRPASARSLVLWEQAVLLASMVDASASWGMQLHEVLATPSTFEAGDDARLPLLAETAARDAAAEAEIQRILARHQAACAAGQLDECARLVELDIVRWTSSVRAVLSNGVRLAFADPVKALRELCMRGSGRACWLVARVPRRGWLGYAENAQVWTSCNNGRDYESVVCTDARLADSRSFERERRTLFERGCTLGDARACAEAAQSRRAAHAPVEQVRALYTKACTAGIAWACAEPASLAPLP
jgi:hypothetical protein